MEKRGVTQIDWVISLSIFLLFLTLFFIYARPSLFTTQEVTDYTDLVISNFKAEAFTQITEYPILIDSEKAGQHRSVIVDYPFQSSAALVEDLYFSIDEGKLILIDDLPKGRKTRKLTLSQNPIAVQSDPNYIVQFYADENETRTGDSIASFQNSNLKQYIHDGVPIIKDFKIQINNADAVPDSTEFLSSDIHSRYKTISAVFDHSIIMTAENDGMLGIIKGKDPKMMRIKIKTKNFPNYYFDQSKFGAFSEECIMKTKNYLNLNGDGAFSIKFSRDVDFTVCPGDEISIYADLELNNTEYTAAFFEDDDRVTSDIEDYHAEIGHEEKYDLLDLSKLSMNESYEETKSRWAYQRGKEFDIQVLSDTGATVYSTNQEPYQMAQVNSKRMLVKTMPDEVDGEKKDYYIQIRTW